MGSGHRGRSRGRTGNLSPEQLLEGPVLWWKLPAPPGFLPGKQLSEISCFVMRSQNGKARAAVQLSTSKVTIELEKFMKNQSSKTCGNSPKGIKQWRNIQ